MGTPFSDIYELFLSQITDYELTVMTETTLEKNMQMWLVSAIPNFLNCKKNIQQYDKYLAEFDEELSSTEQFILSKYMVHAYVSTFLIKEENLSQALNSKDYRMYSPANQLKALTELRNHINSEANALKSQYSWNVHSIREMFKNE